MSAAAGPRTVLSVRALTKRFGGVVAVDDVDLDIADGEVLGVIGPNGAGKSTLVALVGGALAPTSGHVLLDGVDVTERDPARRARLGVGRTHQIPRPFARMSVLDNLMLSSGSVPRGRTPAQRRAACLQLLDRTGLADVADVPAGGLTLLRRKRLELARAMALTPHLIMLDEIGAGLVESETAELIELIRELRHTVRAMLLIEHVMDVITACCDRTAVLDFGRLVAVGPTRQVLADPAVAAVYLGTAAADHADGSAAAAAEERVAAAQGSRTTNVGRVVLEPHSVASLVRVGAPGDTDDSHRAGDARTTDDAEPAPDDGGPARRAGVDGAPLLEVRDLSVAYGGLRALRGVDLEVRPGEVVTLLGANGAGKTTLTRAVAGALPLAGGRIRFDGRDITGLRADRVTALGISQCMEGRRIFGSLTVEENLVLGAGGVASAVRRERLEAVYSVFPMLADRRRQSGTAMSGGQQQMLAVGRALMSAPRLVFFDEVSLGLAPIAVDRLYEALGAIKASGVAMVLVEQNIARGLSLADRAYVLSQGRIALSGPADEVRDDPALTSLYVGEAGGTEGAD